MSALFVVVLLTMTFARPAAADNYDPPGRVARLNYLRGSVSFEPAGEADWVPAIANRPITTGDMLWADDGSRAEMHLGSATIRLDSRTGMSFLNLDDHTTQIQLSEGTLNIRVLRLDRPTHSCLCCFRHRQESPAPPGIFVGHADDRRVSAVASDAVEYRGVDAVRGDVGGLVGLMK